MLRRFLKNERGISAIEFGIAAPVLIIGVLGTFEVGRYIKAATRLDDAAEMLADIVAQQTSISSTTMANFCNGASMSMTPFSTSSFSAAVASVTYSSSTYTRSTDWEDDTCGSASAMSNEVSLAKSLTPVAGNSVIVVTASYTYKLSFATILASSIPMTRIAFARPRSGTTITHS